MEDGTVTNVKLGNSLTHAVFTCCTSITNMF